MSISTHPKTQVHNVGIERKRLNYSNRTAPSPEIKGKQQKLEHPASIMNINNKHRPWKSGVSPRSSARRSPSASETSQLDRLRDGRRKSEKFGLSIDPVFMSYPIQPFIYRKMENQIHEKNGVTYFYTSQLHYTGWFIGIPRSWIMKQSPIFNKG